MNRYRQPFTHFIMFYAGVFLVASLVGVIQELVGAGHNLFLLVICLPAALYTAGLAAYAWFHWVEITETGILTRSWRRQERAKWQDVKTVEYSRRGMTLHTETKAIEVSRWLRRYLELHDFVVKHVPASAATAVPAKWKAELTGPLRMMAHLNFWILLGLPSMGIGLGLLTHGARGLILAAASFGVAYAIARWVSFPVVAIAPSDQGLFVKRAIGHMDLDVKEIDSLTLYEANQSPWSLHNGLRMGYGSAELRARNKSIWIENPLCPELLYHWLLGQGFALSEDSRGYYRRLVRST